MLASFWCDFVRTCGIDGLVQDHGISIANALELLQSYKAIKMFSLCELRAIQ